MLVAKMYGKGDMRLEEMPIPEPKQGELLIKVKAVAICGTDIRMFYNGVKEIDEEHPRILGHEISGVIAKLGKDVKGYSVGDRVAIAPNMGCGTCNQCIKGDGHLCPEYKALGINLDGGFAEYCIVPEIGVRSGNVSILDDNISFAEGAINEPLSCVCNGFEHANIHPGDNVLVVGAGPIGIMHCALAIMAGGKVFLNDISKDRLAKAKELYGQIITINDNLKENIMNYTNNAGADVIITACPVPEIQSLAIELAAIGGRVIFFGGVAQSVGNVPICTNQIHYKQLLVSGTTRASLSQYRKTLRFISSGVLNVKPIISNKLPLCDIAKGFDMARKGDCIKSVIVMD